MNPADLKNLIRRWMNGDTSILDEIAAMDKKAHKAVLDHVNATKKRSISMEKLGVALRNRLNEAA
jgi:hypothetical protein